MNYLVKGGRLLNGLVIIGNFLSIKLVLYFNEEGKIVVYEKVCIEKKVLKCLVEIVKEMIVDGEYDIVIIYFRV